jgi:hypothetical protein
MIVEKYAHQKRALKNIDYSCDLAIAGGGMSGVCAAITAARAGAHVVLVQDRPVLGGNASSEVRLWILGATSHMGNNNRWAREGGVIDEILVENTCRNKEGNPVILDAIILEKVIQEPNIKLLLNTLVYDIEKNGTSISKLFAFCSQNQTFYGISAPLFCDASGDGIIAYMSGAGYRMGAEDKIEMNENFAPDENYGELLGHSIYFYSKDAGKPVQFTAPGYALKDITKIPRLENINSNEHGCKYWWLEYGGRLDTIHDTEKIKWELWSIVYGVWEHIKNSGKYKDVENLTLEWVGLIPGKRESRRFEGYYMLTQNDIVQQHHFDDTVAYGGWAIDLHPVDGVYSEKDGCSQYHAKGIYEIPLRCYLSKDISNLFYSGRIISASHVAHGSSRVMATSSLGAQAVGISAAYCLEKKINPIDLLQEEHLVTVQDRLNLCGQSIPFKPINLKRNLVCDAKIDVSSTLILDELPFDDNWIDLNFSAAQMLPMKKHIKYCFEIEVEALKLTTFEAELRYSVKPDNHTPEVTAEHIHIQLVPGKQKVTFSFNESLLEDQYGFVTFLKNENIRLKASDNRYTGIISVFNKFNKAVNNHGKQIPPEGSGFDSFEFWCPERRPWGKNISMKIQPGIDAFNVQNLFNGSTRPACLPNAWVASLSDNHPRIKINWPKPITVNSIYLYFDTDFDHPMESVQMGHPESVMPFCIRNYRITTNNGKILVEKTNNYQTINRIRLKKPEILTGLSIELEHPSAHVPAAIFYVSIE